MFKKTLCYVALSLAINMVLTFMNDVTDLNIFHFLELTFIFFLFFGSLKFLLPPETWKLDEPALILSLSIIAMPFVYAKLIGIGNFFAGNIAIASSLLIFFFSLLLFSKYFENENEL